MLLTAFLFALGLVLLVGGAEVLVRGAARLAAAIGISPLVIGLTVVAFGTSSPELAVCLQAAFGDRADIALGNVVGSNIFNVLLVLGASAVIAPLAVSRQLVRLDVPLMIAASFALLLVSMDGRIGRLDGALFVTAIVAYTTFIARKSRREGSAARAAAELAAGGPVPPVTPSRGARGVLTDIAFVIVGLILLVLGSRWLVNGAVAVAEALGVDELVIGLTIVAAGTSLPEAATSAIAAIRGERDIAVGNVVGSNLFNILAILGLTAVAGGGIDVAPAALTFDIPVMTAVALACLPVFFTGDRIGRWEGGLFLAYYVAYTVYLGLSASEHSALPVYTSVMLGYVVPITAITLALIAWRELHDRIGS